MDMMSLFLKGINEDRVNNLTDAEAEQVLRIFETPEETRRRHEKEARKKEEARQKREAFEKSIDEIKAKTLEKIFEAI